MMFKPSIDWPHKLLTEAISVQFKMHLQNKCLHSYQGTCEKGKAFIITSNNYGKGRDREELDIFYLNR